jgi:hypothetical protein
VRSAKTKKPRKAAVRPPAPKPAPRRIPWWNIALLALSIAAFGYYAHALNWSLREIAHCLLGMLCLWGPLAALLYVALQRAVADPTVRLIIGCAASYVLTTPLYFATAILRLPGLFIAFLIVAAAFALWLFLRAPRQWPRPDFVLLAIVAGSLVTTIPYCTAFSLQPNGDRLMTLYPDHLYHAGLEYELSRHVPPAQASIRGGTPERAYHMFPHLTVVLIARFTGQSDMLRAHMVYHYLAITTLICGALYAIGFLLAGARLAGYVCAFLPFLFAIATPPILSGGMEYLYFTVLPHATSTVFPTLFTSPQMFSGIAAMYAVLLLIAAILRAPMGERGADLLPVLCSLMVAVLLRFRVHCWMAAMPMFLVFAAVMWYRSRRPIWLLSAATTLVVSGLLYAEMRLPAYLPGTADVQFGLNRLTLVPFYGVWPFSSSISALLRKAFSGTTLAWSWQIVCLSCFAVWDVLGLPLLIAVALVLVFMRRTIVFGFGLFTVGLMALSVGFAICLTMGYDGYSVPGQMLFHLAWYALPLEGVGIAWLLSKAPVNRTYVRVLLMVAVVVSGCASMITQRRLIPMLTRPISVISASGWQAFQYIKGTAPENAVVYDTGPWDRYFFMVSGLAARSSYADGPPGNPVDAQAVRLNPSDNRNTKMAAMEAAKDPASFCALVSGTPITYILEGASNRLAPGAPCLVRLLTAFDRQTTVWKVNRSHP